MKKKQLTIGIRVRVVHPYLDSDSKYYLGREGLVVRELRHGHVIVGFCEIDLPRLKRVAAFPPHCLQEIPDEEARDSNGIMRATGG